jgi:hypothetical protein
MSRALLIITCASTLSMCTAAMADHHGPGSVHVGSDVEVGPRLTTTINTKATHSDQAKLDSSVTSAAGEGGPLKPAPQRSVRVVYPVP